MPESGISISTPEGRQALARGLRENGGKLGGDFVIERFTSLVGCDEYIISGARELELVNRRRTQRRRQLDRKTVTGLIPIRAKGWERRVAPEVAGRTPMRPGLVRIFHQEIHLLGNVDVASNAV